MQSTARGPLQGVRVGGYHSRGRRPLLDNDIGPLRSRRNAIRGHSRFGDPRLDKAHKRTGPRSDAVAQAMGGIVSMTWKKRITDLQSKLCGRCIIYGTLSRGRGADPEASRTDWPPS